MKYFDYPEEKTELFEPSEKNYYWRAEKYTYLCSEEEMNHIDPWNDLQSGFVLNSYIRCALIENGKVTFSNPEVVKSAGKSRKFVVLRSEPIAYRVQSWGELKLVSHEIRSEKTLTKR